MGHPALAVLGDLAGTVPLPGGRCHPTPAPPNPPAHGHRTLPGPPASCSGTGNGGAARRGGLEHVRSPIITRSSQGTPAVRTQLRDVLAQGTLALPTPLGVPPALGDPNGSEHTWGEIQADLGESEHTWRGSEPTGGSHPPPPREQGRSARVAPERPVRARRGSQGGPSELGSPLATSWFPAG